MDHPSRSRRRRLVALALATVLTTLLVTAVAPRSAEARRDEATTAPKPVLEEASLSALRDVPARWLGRPVLLTFQFQGPVETWNPFHTRFGTTDWVGFTVWADDRFTWEQDVYEDPARRLFARRGGAVADVLARARPQDRFQAEAVVREVFLDEPWIELLAVTPLEEYVPEGTILHVGRGCEFLAEGRLEMARQQFERARAGPLPAHARAEIDRLLERCGSPPVDH